MGNWLKKQEKAKGGWQYHKYPYIDNIGTTISPKEETLEDMDITYVQSSHWQRIASIPEEMFEKCIASYKELIKQITTSGFVNIALKLKREAEIAYAC